MFSSHKKVPGPFSPVNPRIKSNNWISKWQTGNEKHPRNNKPHGNVKELTYKSKL